MLNIKTDLHIHSTASDGTWKPEKLIDNILHAGIGLFALTDHDTTENVQRTEELAHENKIAFIRGAEISSSFLNRNYHILALGIDISNKALQKLLESNRILMDEKDDAGIRYLINKYPQLSNDDYMSYVNNPERGGWKSLNYLIDKGLCANYKSFFTLYSDWSDSFNRIGYSCIKDVATTITEAGGVPVLAHPGSGVYGSDIEHTLSMVLESGIMGLECFHPENSPEATKILLDFCYKHKLCITGGSDCHGDFVGTRRLSHPDINLSMLDLSGINIAKPNL